MAKLLVFFLVACIAVHVSWFQINKKCLPTSIFKEKTWFFLMLFTLLSHYWQLSLAATLPQDPEENNGDTTMEATEPNDEYDAEVDAFLVLLKKLIADIGANPKEADSIFEKFLNQIFESDETGSTVTQESTEVQWISQAFTVCL